MGPGPEGRQGICFTWCHGGAWSTMVVPVDDFSWVKGADVLRMCPKMISPIKRITMVVFFHAG